MNEAVSYPAVQIEWPPPPRNKWEREYRAFQALLPELLKTHRGKYVAVHDGQVVASGEDELEVASRVWAKYGYVPIHVDLVTEQPSPPERVPSFREVPPGRSHDPL